MCDKALENVLLGTVLLMHGKLSADMSKQLEDVLRSTGSIDEVGEQVERILWSSERPKLPAL